MKGLAAVPRGVWVLGLVSMCMDLSSELIHSLLPLYMAIGLGASTLTIGIVEGIAEATAMIAKVFSGVISDFFRRRKPLVLLGYGLAALTKPRPAPSESQSNQLAPHPRDARSVYRSVSVRRAAVCAQCRDADTPMTVWDETKTRA